MRKKLISVLNLDRDYRQLASYNSKAISDYNESMLSTLTLLGGLLILLTLMAVPFSNTKKDAVPVYIIAAMLFFTLFFLFKSATMKKYVLIGLYTSFSIFFAFTIYFSVIHSPNMRATILLGAFCIMPLGFLDRPLKMNIFVAFWLTVHSVLAFILKPQYALDDTLNTVLFAILGCFIGNKMVWVRLDSYEANRLLTIQKETDVLTGLDNRRKLFDTLVALETADAEKPTGILMIDIDYFKTFNDTHGHAAGDNYLRNFGKIFSKFSQENRIDFYRYGGEEFVAMAYGYDEDRLSAVAEKLRITVQNNDFDGYSSTVSIGVAYSGKKQIRNYENVIDLADRVVYEAKRLGRNRVCSAVYDPAQDERMSFSHSH